ncbi:MAG: hypothetical protein V3V17_02275 [Alphaproteobacteria bacterium]
MAANTRSLANAAYTDDAFARLENKRLFPRTWVAVACAHELESAGDILPVTVAGRSIILVRNGEGAINGFYNSCRPMKMPCAISRGSSSIMLREGATPACVAATFSVSWWLVCGQGE